ncbi:MAG: hypothetical protein RLZZ175_2587 [Bacteroidota bacterium]|jgi:glycosyltransferase involved in cell wall biosynthesis
MKTNITYIVSNIDKALAFEWIAYKLDKEKFNLSFILLNPGDSALETYLKLIDVKVERMLYTSKFDLPIVIFKLILFFIKNKTKIVHCHLFDACIAGLIASKLLFMKKRIFTRHYSTNHHDYYPNAVKYDKFINYLATDIVSISKNVSKVLINKENVNPDKIHLIHHGFDLKAFNEVENSRIVQIREKYKIPENKYIVGVISRYVELKGLQYIIPAFASFLKQNPNSFLILSNASGDYKNEVNKLLQDFLPQSTYVEIKFESDLPALYKLMNTFIHVPIDETIEAFGQTYVEALASGVPSIFTLSGVANEFIVHDKNALVVDYKNSEEIKNAIIRLLNDPVLRNKLIEEGKKSSQVFDLKKYIFQLENLYLN